MLPNCKLVRGDAVGGHNRKVGNTDTTQECINLVITKEPTANGITISNNKNCYAEFGATHIEEGCESCKSCIFESRLMWLHIATHVMQ